MITRNIITGAVALLGTTAVVTTGAMLSRAHAATPVLVYTCQAQPCANAQEFEVFDANGAPIFSVPEYGGPSVFGDNFSVYAPGSIYHPALTLSYESPAAYARDHKVTAACKAPATWYEPHGIWSCTSSGTWVKKVSL